MLLLLQRKTYIHKTTTCIFVALWFEKSLVSVFTQAQKCEVITSHPFSVLYCDKVYIELYNNKDGGTEKDGDYLDIL